MEDLTEKLLNDFQRNFPLNPMPFEQIAIALNTSTEVVIEKLKELQAKGAVSRVGPVFSPNTVGVSTLAAMAVPADKLEQVAEQVNSYEQVNHNYEREHKFNLWFVATADNHDTLQNTLNNIEKQTGHKVLSLPLLKEYHIDLGFRMKLNDRKDVDEVNTTTSNPATEILTTEAQLASAEDLIEVIQGGLPLVARPYQEIAEQLGWSEEMVIKKLKHMVEGGTIKRLGIVVRHHELGYRANAMVVWDVPDQSVDQFGETLGQQDCVTLCYQRPRRLPDWPYNLFCMVHGRNREEVLECIVGMTEYLGAEDIPHTVLFSGKRFKQRGARYRHANNGQKH
ncbi:MAG: Lrp/AsnC family transcriptional regulator [Gammaproteobacteria bacterium]|nr:Lrp/AsnC family transcriptional regulator [Gammaproteobacteria bacterium]MCW8924389.1 Lrp/AsnC family transcriptional regulator [Gammaproteobacteria bacterium]